MPRVAKTEPQPVEDVEPQPVENDDCWHMLAPLVYRDWPEAREYFYDGELVVVNGKVYVPRSRPEWAQRLLHLGYEWADGVQPEDFQYAY